MLQNPENGGLAAAAGTDESQRLFRPQYQAQFVQHAQVSVAGVVEYHILELYQPL